MTSIRFAGIAIALCLPCLATLSAQGGAAASQSFFLAGSEGGPGAVNMQSTNWRLDAGLGNGAVAARASSTNFVLQGSWLALRNGSTLGRPWVSGVSPIQGLLGVNTPHRCARDRAPPWRDELVQRRRYRRDRYLA